MNELYVDNETRQDGDGDGDGDSRYHEDGVEDVRIEVIVEEDNPERDDEVHTHTYTYINTYKQRRFVTLT